MERLVDFIVLGLGTYQIANLLQDTGLSGPWDVMHKLRHLAGVRYDKNSDPYGTNELAKAILCIYCSSVSLGFLATLLYLLLGQIAIWLFFPLALSATVTVIHGRMLGGD